MPTTRVLEDAPAYLAVLSNRPLDAITNAETLRRLQLGLDNIPLPQRASVKIADAASDDPFRVAFIKIKSDQGLYREASNGVTFLAPALFRASIPLPAEVPVGTYEVDVRLFVDGAQIARTPAPFEVYKSGFEQVVTRRRAGPRRALRPRRGNNCNGHRLVPGIGCVPAGLSRGASTGYAGTSRPARLTGWKRSNECWKRSRPAARARRGASTR